MSTYKEAIEDRLGPIPNFIDATEGLLEYYGPDSLACHGLRQIDDTRYEALFIVPENLCGPQARPPMFDKLRITDDAFTTQTEEADAYQHFIDSVTINNTPIKLIPGHKITGLAVAAAELFHNQEQEEPEDLMLTYLDFIRYKGFVLPNQELALPADIQRGETGVVYSPTVSVKNFLRTEGRGFKCDSVGRIDQETSRVMMLQHWLFETTAQGFGAAAGLVKNAKDLVPVLMQTERTRFAPRPIKMDDLISTVFTFQQSPAEQAFGNATIFVNGERYGDQSRLMDRFYPIEQIAEGIEETKKQVQAA